MVTTIPHVFTRHHNIVSIFSLGAIGVALGSGAAGLYTTSTKMWENLHQVCPE